MLFCKNNPMLDIYYIKNKQNKAKYFSVLDASSRFDGQFSENRKAVKAAQLTPGVRAQRESLLASQAYLLFTHPPQAVGDSSVFHQRVLLNMAGSEMQTKTSSLKAPVSFHQRR